MSSASVRARRPRSPETPPFVRGGTTALSPPGDTWDGAAPTHRVAGRDAAAASGRVWVLGVRPTVVGYPVRLTKEARCTPR